MNEWWSHASRPEEAGFHGEFSFSRWNDLITRERMAVSTRSDFVFVSWRTYDVLRRINRGWFHWWNWPGFAFVMALCSVPAALVWLAGGRFDPRDIRDTLHSNAVRGELRQDDDFGDVEEW